jgi:site-specific DNA recombinase
VKTNNSNTNNSDHGPLVEPCTAAAYVRVSSVGQLGRDGDEDGDGYSIPAQVRACEAKAASLDARVAKAYVERAESARSDDRPVLQQMLRELPSLGVKYLIVHKVDRLARNRLDDAVLYQRLVGMGITLVSATENIDETPAGRLMHGMLASFAEYYSNNLATEIKKGLLQKHAMGGTPFKPPLGYLSKRDLSGGQDIRTVVIDPDRAPLIRLAYVLYATGEWTLSQLADHLEAQGLRMPATRRQPERPVSFQQLHRILSNPYYKGVIEYAGRRNLNGNHARLVEPDLWDQVQLVLTAHRVAGDRPSVHLHYLRGSVVCAECHGRLLFGRHRSRSGRQYEYFSCINRDTRRRDVRCQTGHYPVARVEEAVTELWATLELDDQTKEQVRRELSEHLEGRSAVVTKEAERHERTLRQIEANQEKLVQLYYRDLVSEEVLRKEQHRLKKERAAAERLKDAATAQATDLNEALEEALARIDRPYDAYLESDGLKRRTLNQAVFDRIEVGSDGNLEDVALAPAYAALAAWKPGLGRPVIADGPGPYVDAVRPSSASVHERGRPPRRPLPLRPRSACERCPRLRSRPPSTASHRAAKGGTSSTRAKPSGSSTRSSAAAPPSRAMSASRRSGFVSRSSSPASPTATTTPRTSRRTSSSSPASAFCSSRGRSAGSSPGTSCTPRPGRPTSWSAPATHRASTSPSARASRTTGASIRSTRWPCGTTPA